jgi:flagella basal body P-ring formation protein FlgA
MLWLMLIPVAELFAAGRAAGDIERLIRERMLDNGQEYVVTVTGVINDPSRGYDSLAIEPLSSDQIVGNLPLKVSFYLEGQQIQVINTTARVSLFCEVLVATVPFATGDELTPDRFELARRDITSLHEAPVVSFDAIDQMTARKNIGAGSILLTSMLKKSELIRRGDQVQIAYEHGSLRITATGEARGAGGEGDRIKVKNSNSNKMITAEVVNEQWVKVVK